MNAHLQFLKCFGTNFGRDVFETTEIIEDLDPFVKFVGHVRMKDDGK